MTSNSKRRGKAPPLSHITPFRGKSPQFDATVFIDPTARLIGDVLLGPGVSVWPLAVLRADNNRIMVGERSVLLDKVLVESPNDHPNPLSLPFSKRERRGICPGTKSIFRCLNL